MSVALAGASSDTEADSTRPTAPPEVRRLGPLRRLWPDIRWYRYPLFGSAVLSWIGMMCDILQPVLTGRIVDGPVAHRDFAGMWWPVLLVTALGVIGTITAWTRRWVVARPAARLEVDLRARLFRRLQTLSVGA
ncbi:ABC transporter transmembrane domain-containing protein, partial [Nocardia sp. CDC159]